MNGRVEIENTRAMGVPTLILVALSSLSSLPLARSRSVRTHLKRRRKEIDYKILSQRGKNRESNAFVLLEAQLKNSAAKSLMKGAKTPNSDGAPDVVC